MLRELLTTLVFSTLLTAGLGVEAQDEEPPPLDPDDIIIPDLLYDDPPADEPSAEPVEPPATAEIVIEDTVVLCDDGLDNDGDGHVDCEDQDCEIFAVCVKAPPPAARAEPQAEPKPQPKPKPVKVPGGYKRAESSKMRVLKIMGHATLWPGLGIAVLTTAFRFSDDADYCGEGDGDFLGVCSGWGWALGGGLAATGAILLSIYYVKRKRIVENNPELALVVSPVIGEEFAGVGGALVF